MPVSNLTHSTENVFFPSSSNYYVKLTVTADDSTVYTIANTYSGLSTENYVIDSNFSNYATKNLGSFDFKIVNKNGMFTDLFNGGEMVNLYADETDATTLIFTGLIDNVKYGLNMSDGFYLSIDGRVNPELIDKTVTGISSSQKADIAIAGILYFNFTDTELTFWNGTEWIICTYIPVEDGEDIVNWSGDDSSFPSTLINTTYQHKKGWNVITEICNLAGLDCYVEYDASLTKWVIRTFLVEQLFDDNSCVSYGINLLGINEFGIDNDSIVNRVICYGNTESDNIILVNTQNDTVSQANFWIKDSILNESSLTTMDEVYDKAVSELAINSIGPDSGSVQTLFMPNLKPGSVIYLSVPYCNIDNYYKTTQISHKLDSNSFTTSIDMTKRMSKINDFFVGKVNAEEFVSGLSNINAMEFSYNVYFDENPSIMNHSNTQEINGQLSLQGTNTTGTATSNVILLNNNVTECEFRVYSNLETTNDTYEVSNTGGNTWETYDMSSGEVHTFGIADKGFVLG